MHSFNTWRNISSSTKISSKTALRLIALCAFAFGFLHLVLSIFYQSGTYDEWNHYSWSQELVQNNKLLPRVHSHTSTTPVTIFNVMIGQSLKDTSIVSSISRYLGVQTEWWPKRIPGLGWYLILVLACLKLGNILGGEKVALLFSIFISLTPSIISHASLVTVDIPFAASSTWLIYFSILICRRVTLVRILGFSLFLGLSMITKFSSILLLPYVFAIICLNLLKIFRCRDKNDKVYSALLYLLVPYLCSLIVNFGYRFIEVKYWTSEYQYQSVLLQTIFNFLPDLWLPLPQSFISGIDGCLTLESSKTWNVILLDKSYPHGSPLYFPLNFLFKTPSLIILSILFGFINFLLARKTAEKTRLLLNLAILMFYFCFIFSTQVGIRYILFILPVFYLLSTIGLCKVLSNKKLVLVSVLTLVECLITFPHFSGYMTSYFNRALVPTSIAFKFVIDSNFDWNQTSSLFWNNRKVEGPVNPDILQPGINIFSANHLAGVWWDFPKNAWIRRNIVPVSVEALTFFVFDIDKENFKKYLQAERSLVASKTISAYCNSSNSLNLDEINEDWIPLDSNKLNNDRKCIQAKNTLIISISAKDKSQTPFKIGSVMPSGNCKYQDVRDGEKGWFEVNPGFHVLCFNEDKKLLIKRE